MPFSRLSAKAHRVDGLVAHGEDGEELIKESCRTQLALGNS